MKETNEVKKDLRELKKHTHAVKQLESAQRMHFARIKLLEALPKSEKTENLIEKEKLLISSIDYQGVIEKSCTLEEKYMAAINTLPLVDRGMIVDAFINGTPYWKIGLEIGYSEEGVRKRVSKIISKIAQLM